MNANSPSENKPAHVVQASTVPPPPPPPPVVCWVARAVYGETNPDWMVFREWLLHEAPAWFRSLYIRHGERFARWIETRRSIKALLRGLMDRIVLPRR
jgi:hypothetical protein